MKITSERIKEAMEIRGMNQFELIEKTGIDKETLSSYLMGEHKLKPTDINLLAMALNVEVLWLMGYDDVLDLNSEGAKAGKLVAKMIKDKNAQRLLEYYFDLTVKDKDKIFKIIEVLANNKEEKA